MTRVEAEERCQECGLDDALFADGFDGAIVGIGRQFNDAVVVYDWGICVDILVSGGATYEEAAEWMDFNVLGAFVGPNTPVFILTTETS